MNVISVRLYSSFQVHFKNCSVVFSMNCNLGLILYSIAACRKLTAAFC